MEDPVSSDAGPIGRGPVRNYDGGLQRNRWCDHHCKASAIAAQRYPLPTMSLTSNSPTASAADKVGPLGMICPTPCFTQKSQPQC